MSVERAFIEIDAGRVHFGFNRRVERYRDFMRAVLLGKTFLWRLSFL